MAIMFRNPVSLPASLVKELDAYLEEGEEVVDAIRETFILAVDFRWLIITSYRVVMAVVKFMSVEFRDVHFDGIDMQLTKGTFFDNLHLKSMTDDYNAQFYALTRSRTEKFLQILEDERDRYQKEKKKMEKMVEQEAMEELGSKGPLDEPRQRTDVLVDIDHNSNVLDKRMEGKRSPKQEIKAEKSEEDFGENESFDEEGGQPASTCESVQTIKELKELLDEGAISEKEYIEKKNQILKRI